MRIAPTATSELDFSDARRSGDKIRARWIFGGLVLLGAAWFVFQLFGPGNAIIVSKETTFITAPLGEDGLPDFKTYLLEHDSEGVTPENNAAVLIWQAMWPGELAQEHWLPMAHALGLKEIPSGQHSLVPMYDQSVRQEIAVWLAERFSSELDDQSTDKFLIEVWRETLRDVTADQLIDRASDRPWTRKQVPPLAKWVEDNRQPMDLLVEASGRSHYYSPKFLDDSDDSLIAMLLPDIQTMRSAERALMARAMWHLGEGRNAKAWQDVLACHRLARLIQQEDTLVEQLVAIAIDGVACRGTITLLHHGELRPDEALQIFSDLSDLPRVSSMSRSIDQGERLFFIDSVIRMAQGKMDDQDLSGTGGNPLPAMSLATFDWNFILREGNRWYDRFVDALQLPTQAQRKTELRKIDNDLTKLGTRATGPGALIGSFFSRRQRSRMMANILISLFLPALESAGLAEERSIVLLDMTRLAAALAVYRSTYNEYPAELAALVPEILPELPVDLYSGQPFLYERKDDGGYLLYSVFENGVDDGGTNLDGKIVAGEWVEEQSEDFDYEASDLVIRVPQPAFELPEPPQDVLP